MYDRLFNCFWGWRACMPFGSNIDNKDKDDFCKNTCIIFAFGSVF